MNEKNEKRMVEHLRKCAEENQSIHGNDGDWLTELDQKIAKELTERASCFEEATGKSFCWEGPLLDKPECQEQLLLIGTPWSEIANLEWPKGYSELVGIVETKLALKMNPGNGAAKGSREAGTRRQRMYGLTVVGKQEVSRHVERRKEEHSVHISNEGQWTLLQELLKGGGRIIPQRASALFPDKNDRRNVVFRLNECLAELDVKVFKWELTEI
ncbi:MAG: hypothetical protein ABGZ35_21725 [Planctomycetaceae bacterium]